MEKSPVIIDDDQEYLDSKAIEWDAIKHGLRDGAMVLILSGLLATIIFLLS